MKGVTIATFKKYFGNNNTCNDLRNIDDEKWLKIFKDGYWDKCKGDEIENQSIADIIVDWAWMSGVKTAIKKVQKILNVDVDGIVGKQTITAINNADSEILFKNIYNERVKYYTNIVKRTPSQQVFLNGWMNRLNDFEYA
jgi:lysozyme family protein